MRFGLAVAVLVAVEFTGERRKLTHEATLARKAAVLQTDFDGAESAPLHSSGLDFDASLAEFEELARSAGADIAATLVQLVSVSISRILRERSWVN